MNSFPYYSFPHRLECFRRSLPWKVIVSANAGAASLRPDESNSQKSRDSQRGRGSQVPGSSRGITRPWASAKKAGRSTIGLIMERILIELRKSRRTTIAMRVGEFRSGKAKSDGNNTTALFGIWGGKRPYTCSSQASKQTAENR